MNNLFFYESVLEISKNNNVTVLIRKEINSKMELFKLYQNELKFPDYFGENWDAFYDCLIDLSWINQVTINLIHEDLPLILSEKDLNIYISILSEISYFWKNSLTHQFRIYFPFDCKNKIDRLIH